jgi:hypothetical protein
MGPPHLRVPEPEGGDRELDRRRVRVEQQPPPIQGDREPTNSRTFRFDLDSVYDARRSGTSLRLGGLAALSVPQ